MSWWERQLRTYFKGAISVNESTVADGDVLSYNSTTKEWTPSGAWADYVPNYSASGSMTFTSVVTTTAKYCRIGNVCFVRLDFTGTTGGSASNQIIASAPITPVGTQNGTVCTVRDAGSGAVTTGFVQPLSATGFSFYNSTVTNWSLGASRICRANFFYEVA